ncbi:MAG: diacylglycerol kinase family protein [Alkalibacterium sp.]
MNDVMIVANPSSGKKQAEAYAKKLEQIFREHERETDLRKTEEIEDISRFAIEASEKKYDQLIIIGGDGTVSEAANGLNNRQYRPTIGIIPAGTVNNIAKGLGIDGSPDAVIRHLIDYKKVKADVGKVNDRLFLSSVSAGPVPETVWEVSDEQKEKYGQAAYFMEGIKSLRNEETYELELEIDEEITQIDLNLILIGVNSSIAGIPNFFDEAKKDDGRLYMFGLKQSTLGEKFTVLQALLFSNREFNDMQDLAFTVPFKRAVITLKNKETFTTIDGEQGPVFPVILEVLPQYLTFLVSN